MDSSEKDELLNNGMKVGRTFDSMRVVEEFMEQLRKICFYPMTFQSRTTVESHNKKVILSLSVII